MGIVAELQGTWRWPQSSRFTPPHTAPAPWGLLSWRCVVADHDNAFHL